MKTTSLRLSNPPGLFPVTYTNGPGLRYVMWTQGCSLRCCKNCLNPELLNPAAGESVLIEHIVDHLARLKQELSIEGVTILGGEPTDQAVPLLHLLPSIQALGLSTMLYTGHSLHSLFQPHINPEIARLMNHIDILVEGPYHPDLDFPGTLWRGSLNQRFLLLSSHYTIPILYDKLRQTHPHLYGQVDVIPLYNGGHIIRKHWKEPLPRKMAIAHKNRLPQHRETVKLILWDIPTLSWLPELEPQPPETLPSPKGITGVLDTQNRLHLFGFQKKEVVQSFKTALATQGVHF